MATDTITIRLKLNQQQLDLVDRTVAKGAAADRIALVRRALAETAEGYADGQVAPNREIAR